VTHLGCDGMYSDISIANCLLIMTVKEFWKSVNIWWSYEAYKKWCHFFGPPCRPTTVQIFICSLRSKIFVLPLLNLFCRPCLPLLF